MATLQPLLPGDGDDGGVREHREHDDRLLGLPPHRRVLMLHQPDSLRILE